MPNGLKRTSFSINEEIHRHFKIKCVEKDKNMSDVLNKLITMFLVDGTEDKSEKNFYLDLLSETYKE